MNKTYLTGEVKAIEDGNPNGSFEVILSAPTLDRDGEVIDFGAFEPLPKHITFDIDHGLSTATTVGSGEPRYEDGVLKVSGSFSSIPRAQEVRTLVNEGHIRTTSVAFMAPKREVKDGVPHIVSAEILNGAFVPVPSNRESVVLAAKSHREAALPGLKAIEGSYEERREQIAEAVRETYSDAYWTYVVASFEDHAVIEVDGRDGVERYDLTYTFEDGVITLGDAVPVDVVEVVQPKSEDADDTKIPDADPEDAAPAAIPPASSATAMANAYAAQAEVLLID
jgi:hypothetical protein